MLFFKCSFWLIILNRKFANLSIKSSSSRECSSNFVKRKKGKIWFTKIDFRAKFVT